jgi:hypothetical protein
MQILRDQADFDRALATWTDAGLVQLLTERLAFYAELDEPIEQLFKQIHVEPRDTLEDLDIEFNGGFLKNHYSGRRYGEPGFQPSFEALELHSGFYAMLFCEGGGDYGVEVIVPDQPGIDARLLSLCAALSSEVQQP